MKIIAFLLLMSLAHGYVQAQSTPGGEFSVGPRFGGSSGISLKNHFKSNNGALELIGAFKNFDKKEELDGFTLTAMLEKLAPLGKSRKLNAIIGGGSNLNFKGKFDFGVSGMLGFDLRLSKVPISMQVDWTPTLFLLNETYFSGVNGAFTIRYVINHK